MHRPVRTSWISIAAIASFVAFAMLAVFAARSFWSWDRFTDGTSETVTVTDGGITYQHVSAAALPAVGQKLHLSGPSSPDSRSIRRAIWGFRATRRVLPSGLGQVEISQVTFPLWPLLLLLIVMPVLWFISRPEGAAAFPVLTDVSSSHHRTCTSSPSNIKST